MENIKRHKYIMISILVLIGISLFLGGCAGMTAEEKKRGMDVVGKAQAALESAKANPDVASNASVTLYEAEQILKEAEKVKDDIAKKEHLAYMSIRKTQLAVATAERTVAEREALNLTKEKDQLLLKMREKEITKTETELEKARAELAELKAKPTDRGMVITLGDVLFKTNRANLSPGAEKTIDQLSNFMKKYPDRKINIEGHTDSVGSAEYNLTLSRRRAESVKKALVEKGIETSRIETKGYGETYPVADNQTASGRQQNRRVEVIIPDEGQSPK